MKRIVCAIFLFYVVGADVVVAADIQKWVDEQGKVHYGSRPPEGKQGQAVKGAVSIATPVESVPSVVLYTTSWCGYCKQARAFMNKNSINFTEYDIEKNVVAEARYKQMGGRGVPFLVSGDRTIGGFSASSYTSFFDL